MLNGLKQMKKITNVLFTQFSNTMHYNLNKDKLIFSWCSPLLGQSVVRMQNTHVVNAVQTACKSAAFWRLLEISVSS